MGAQRWLLAGVLMASGPIGARAAPCPAPATLTVLAENLASDPSVSLQVDGELLDEDVTCAGAGATTYTATFACTGSGATRCGRREGLRPGAWVHRVRMQVTGSDEQAQSRRGVMLAAAPGVENVVSWTVYPRTFVLRQADGEALRGRLDEAATFTAANPGSHALVTFDPATFPGAHAPREIRLGFTPVSTTLDFCAPDAECPDGRLTTYCLSGSRLVVDALDAQGQPGGVVVSIGRCARSVFRITGSDNLLRGLELRGSRQIDPTIPVDTLAVSGPGAQRNCIEQCIVRGPTKGDAVNVDGGAGAPGGPDHEAVVAASEITGAEDKGVKVAGAHATIVDSCIHDNRDGGIQATGGGSVTATRNVVQLNRLGEAQNGLLVGVPGDANPQNAMTTDGNVVRFSGARGLSVVNAALGLFQHDVVADNQEAGARVETTLAGPAPVAAFRGVGLACNHRRLTGACGTDPNRSCAADAECPAGRCEFPAEGEPDGFGVVRAACGGCAVPDVDLGVGGPGRRTECPDAEPAPRAVRREPAQPRHRGRPDPGTGQSVGALWAGGDVRGGRRAAGRSASAGDRGSRRRDPERPSRRPAADDRPDRADAAGGRGTSCGSTTRASTRSAAPSTPSTASHAPPPGSGKGSRRGCRATPARPRAGSSSHRIARAATATP